jgi:hypothetical protein
MTRSPLPVRTWEQSSSQVTSHPVQAVFDAPVAAGVE